METHHEVVSAITLDLQQKFISPLIYNKQMEMGRGGLYELAEELTDEFEKMHEGYEWDGDFFDTIEEFLVDKFNEPESAYPQWRK